MKLNRMKLWMKIFLGIFIILIISSYVYEKLTSDVPRNIPKVTIKYNDEVIPTSPGEYTWLKSVSKNQPKTGNSYLAGQSYDVGIKVSKISVEPNSEIVVIFNTAPPELILRTWLVGDSVNEIKEESNSSKKINIIKLPKEKGEYIYEVQGYWSNTNFTSTIFRVLVE